ncbi:MAG TPA: retropepsin-like aspartic protease [Anaerolineae bacterium]|nr:retropepsin-like aspartic protease [Anaerolineae bacterium]
MKIALRHGLPFVSVTIAYQDRQLQLADVLLDTGSAGTVFSVDGVLPIDLLYEADDAVHRIRGVGGAEFVFSKRVDSLSLGELRVNDFNIEVGAMDYGFGLDGILGLDFLMKVGAVIDLAQRDVHG